MRKLDVSAVSDSAQILIKKGTLQFLQDAHTELFAQLLIGLIGPGYDPAVVYVFNGVKNTGAGANYIFGAGAVFYNGEIYRVDATSFSTTGSNVPVFTEVTTQYTTDADPVTFSDTTTHNVHNIRKLMLSSAASASGIADYTDAVFPNFPIPAQVNLTGSGVSGSYPNYNIDGPNGIVVPKLKGTYHVGNGAPVEVTISLGVTLPNANYTVLGSLVSVGTSASDDTTLIWSIRSKTTTTFNIVFIEIGAVTQNVDFDWILFQ